MQNLETPLKIREKRLQIVDMVLLLEEKANTLIDKANKPLNGLKKTGNPFSITNIF